MASTSAGMRFSVPETKAFATGGKVTVSLADLPPGRKIRHILLRLEAVIVQGAGAALIPGQQLRRLYQAIVIGKRVRVTGMFLRALNWLQQGRNWSAPADVPAAAATYNRIVEVMVPYCDLRAASPDDTDPNTEFFKSQPIEISWDSEKALFGANTGITGNLRTVVFHEPASPGVIPAVQVLNYEDWNQQTVRIQKPGRYTHLFVYIEAATLITDANLTDVIAYVDGEPWIDKVKLGELSTLWSWYNAEGTSLEAASTTVPLGGEELNDQPGVGAGAGAGISTEILPLTAPGDKYLLSKCLQVEEGIRIDFSGAGTAFRIGYRYIEPKTPESAARAAAMVGVSDPFRRDVRTKTHSKSREPVPRALAASLPMRFV